MALPDPSPRIADVELVMKEVDKFSELIAVFPTRDGDRLRRDWWGKRTLEKGQDIGWKASKAFEP